MRLSSTITLLFLFYGALAYSAAREVPDFAGKPRPPEDPAYVIGRGVLLPPHLVMEYGFRQPLRWLGRTAELNDIPFLVSDFFKFGDEKQFGLYPSVLIDFGFLASFGARFRWKNFVGDGSRITLRAATGGTNYGVLGLGVDLPFGDKNYFGMAAEIEKRPDFIFHDTGPMSSKDDRFRYGAVRKQVEADLKMKKVLGGTVALTHSLRAITFFDGNCCDERGIDTAIGSGLFGAPSRYPAGYTAFIQKLAYNYGGRVSRPKNRQGATFDGRLSHAFDLDGGGWWIYGGAVSVYHDLTGKSRLLSLRVDTELSDPHGGTSVPFDQLPSLGGDRLPGFLTRRFIDQSVFAMTLEYKWPVLSLVDGVMHFAVGNVFRRNLEGLQWGWLRKSIGIGVETTGEDSSPVSILLALGSAPFDLGGDFNEFRFSLSIGGGI